MREIRGAELEAHRPLPVRRLRIGVASPSVGFSGGLLRFERVGVLLRSWGHDVSFVRMSETSKDLRPSALPVLPFQEASNQVWDAIMVPGAGIGFSDKCIGRFAEFRASNFGVRVQHLLNDQSKRHRFLRVNESFSPHVLLFNNSHWPAGSFTEFKADRFHILTGAVDVAAFYPRPYRTHPLDSDRWVVGAQTRKNTDLLIAALEFLPPNVTLRLFGPDAGEHAKSRADLVASGRLELVGPLLGRELAEFYSQVDCVVSAEDFAGWGNVAAEALASGVPVICTAQGTRAFAKHLETAIVIETTDAKVIAAAIDQLMTDRDLCSGLARRGREIISRFDWESYARDLLRLLPHDGHQHYIHAPERGLFGKWSVEGRRSGLEILLREAEGMTVADFGAAEGLVSIAFLESGAGLAHGFEMDAWRVLAASEVARPWAQAKFHQADLADWNRFHSSHAGDLLSSYDIVLYLGLHQHLPERSRLDTLKAIAKLTRRYFAIRVPPHFFEAEPILDIIDAEGLTLIHQQARDRPDHLGELRIFRRNENCR